MFRRSRLGARRARRTRSARCGRSYRRKPRFELLEDRRLLAVITVNSELDNVTPGDGLVTLREAIIAANTDGPTDGGGTGSGPDMIVFAPALNGMTIDLALALGQLPTITQSLTIDASSLANGLSINAATADLTPAVNNGDGVRIFEINDGDNATNINVELIGLRLTGGDVSGDGGAIRSFENLTIRNSTIFENSAQGLFGHGGGIAVNNATNSANLTVINSTIRDNVANVNGGGVAAFINEGAITIDSSTLSGNSATGSGTGGGGGILFAGTTADLTIRNSTISGNSTGRNGGGVNISGGGGTVSGISSSTIANNTAINAAGGVWREGPGGVFVTNTIIAGNTNAASPDINMAAGGGFQFNLIGNNTGSGLAAAPVGSPDANGNLIGTAGSPINPLLGLLQFNGGPTQTRALLTGSPAIDAGNPFAMAGVGGTPQFDQRGPNFGRVLDGDLTMGARLDIGAFEAPPPPDRFEFNDTIATATFLGSDPFVTLRDLSIHTPTDVDFFKYTAHYTGKLIIRIHFDHSVGDLDLEVQDMTGDVVATSMISSDTMDFEELVIPVVAQRMYFVRVFGSIADEPPGEFVFNTDDVNTYSLEIENFPAPVPTAVHLDPASDNGQFNNDNVTSDRRPQFFIQADVLNFVDENQDGIANGPPAELRVLTAAQAAAGVLSGVAVEVTLVNTSNPAQAPIIGFADPLSVFLPTVYSFTPAADLPDGVYFVTAATRIRDGQMPSNTGRSTASPPLWFTILADDVGPRVSAVEVTGFPNYDLLDTKPREDGPTPLVDSITIRIIDPPDRIDPPFLTEALNATIADFVGNYSVVGDHVGVVQIVDVIVTNIVPVVGGGPAMATIELQFASPLPDDRYTLTVRDSIVDLAGNRLDGESNASAPGGSVSLPSGNGVPGGDFVARFTVDSRPEIGSWVAQSINIDINGNFVWDPAASQIGGDATNVDLSFTLPVANADGSVGLGGFNVHDLLFAGKFTNLVPGTAPPPRLFDQLAAFGNSAQLGGFRWIVDTDSDGVVTLGTDILTMQPALPNFNIASAIPVAGNFDGNAANGDEIGLYNAGRWALDSNRNFVIDAGDTFITNNLLGMPIVGDFDGDGLDDLAVFNNNQFFFDLAFNGFGGVDATLVWGFPGVLDRPVAADMDQDGIDDIGLWVPRNSAGLPQGVAEWYFLISNDPTGNLRATGTINRLNHAFTPVPFGFDILAEFGDERSQPIVGNFDPPGNRASNQSNVLPGDFNGDGRVDQSDYNVWRTTFNSSTNLAADANGDGIVDTADYTIWRANVGNTTGAASGGGSQASAISTVLEAAISETTSGELDEPAPSLATMPMGKSRGYAPARPASARITAPAPASLAERDSLLLTVAERRSVRIDEALGDDAFRGALLNRRGWDEPLEAGNESTGSPSAIHEVAWRSWDEL